ncbi:GNAT family N-acetyltransferase [Liquorilactobacillus satsumensis]|uniref:Acetyltransferase n=1 Tax=Liquorilactobacillus satsumensis DSM 16230 = JCM 12392 TaxID=1423801 RepID=A0A0R1VE12_9LACO|nr:GNAT family N-acetyltransferase [Liquorilactobacillus satsumensis]KRM00044.1 acetyltransferase [Liquorilactobacillus satsumensis DSM 16230 = JCM 12392]MCC7667003.1 N-acetyltransferase [Liquorilactobacillus satsumensis]MCP9329699.1 GNAT family N-acetyltransferase [Liquorilactobacillus satsumensis]MCP9358157.1 GNAT family N-acetyltransferase [Liquorilactobacillus satsumensis]MCP9372168.1 GNAT family N-acetyltransferase [Liquorilactobacillus satsumensis]
MLKFEQTDNLDSKCYQDALAIRKQVFIKEQGVAPELEVENEAAAEYFVAYYDGQPAATARVLREEGPSWHVQRVAALPEFRGKGISRALMQVIEQAALKRKIYFLKLGAQDQAQGFYSKLGYQVTGPGFLDAGIAHHQMEKKLH